MARRGRFGRLPRVSPSLTSTLVSIAREMQNQRANNLMDAWSKGGNFEGKKATDELVLKFWNDRLKGVDKNDPLADTYRNLVTQYDYKIKESKQSVLYAQGKITDQQMASFYLNWAKKIPQNSEFYRELQRDGARFLEAAKARGRAGAKAAQEKAYQDAQNKTMEGARAGNAVTQYLTNIAVANGLLGAEDNKGLSNLSDPASLIAVLGNINSNPDRPVYTTLDGKTWTGKDVMSMIAKLDPSFKPQGKGEAGVYSEKGISASYILSVLQGKHDTYMKAADRAMKTGHAGDYKKLTDAATGSMELVREVKIWGVAPAYNMVIKQRDAVLYGPDGKANPLTSDVEKQAAMKQAGDPLAAMANGNNGLDMRTRNTLLSEARANYGDTAAGKVATFGEDYLGLKTQAPGNEGDATGASKTNPAGNLKVANLAEQITLEQENLTKNPAAYSTVKGTRDPDTGVFQWDPKGADYGVVEDAELDRAGVSKATIAVPQIGGGMQLLTVIGQPITTEATDANGVKVNPGLTNSADQTQPTDVSARIGTVYTYDDHGLTKRVYLIDNRFYTKGDGDTGPWAVGVHERDDGKGGVILDMKELIPGDKTADSYTYNPKSAMSQPVLQAGFNASTQGQTPLMASIILAQNPRDVASSLAKDPVARGVLYGQEIRASGGLNEDGTPKNPALLASIMDADSQIITGTIVPGSGQPPMYNANRSDPAFSANQQPGRPDSVPLDPTDAFAALQMRDPVTGQPKSSVYQAPGSSNRATQYATGGPGGYGKGGPAIVAPAELKIPSYTHDMSGAALPQSSTWASPLAPPTDTRAGYGSVGPSVAPSIKPTVAPAAVKPVTVQQTSSQVNLNSGATGGTATTHQGTNVI